MPDVIAGTNARVRFLGTDGAWHDLNAARVELTTTHEAPIPPQPRVGDVSLSFTVNTKRWAQQRALARLVLPQHPLASLPPAVQEILRALYRMRAGRRLTLPQRLHALFPCLKPAQIWRLAQVMRRKQPRSRKHICSVQGTRPIHCVRGAQ